jgi:hypothetical protein
VQTFAIQPLVQIGMSLLQPFLAFLGRAPIFAILRPSAWGVLSDSILEQERALAVGNLKIGSVPRMVGYRLKDASVGKDWRNKATYSRSI